MKRFFTTKKYVIAGFMAAILCTVSAPFVAQAQAVGPLIATAQALGQVASGSGITTNLIGQSFLAITDTVFKKVAALTGNLFLTVSSWFLWASGVLLVQVMDFTVVKMTANINGISGLNIAWTVFRDLANMFFIFLLLYAAIAQILQLSGANAKKTIVNVVIIALLINFSLFFTKIIIDASNIVTIGFYNEIAKDAGGKNGLAGPFITQMGLTSLFSTDAGDGTGILGTENHTLAQIFFTGMMGSLFLIVAAFVFFAANMMFIMRFVTLIFLMILSPIAYVMSIVPGGKKFSGKWWSTLFDNCLFAPAYMAMMYATLLMLKGVVKTPGDIGKTLRIGGTAPPADAFSVIMNYVIIIIMMVACLIVAKNFGAYGADAGIKRIKNAGNWMRGKVGRGAMRTIGVQKLDQMLEDSRFGNTRVGSIVRGATTEKLVNMKVGDRSIKDVNKEYKEIDKKLGEYHFKAEEKKFDKGLEKLRTKELVDKNYLGSADLDKQARAKLEEEQEERKRVIENLKKSNAPKMAELENEVATLEKELNTMAPDKNAFANTASVSEKQEFKKIQDQITAKKKTINEIGTTLSPETQQQIKDLTEKLENTAKEIETKNKEESVKRSLHAVELAAIKKNQKASDKEREKWLNPELERVAEELETGDILGKAAKQMGVFGLPYLHDSLGINTRKDAAKEIRKKAKTSFNRKEMLGEISRAIIAEGDKEKGAILRRILESKKEDLSTSNNEEKKESTDDSAKK